MTRGHKSRIGVGLVIEVETGIPVDFEVLSNYCPLCTKKKKKVSPAEYAT